MFKITYVIWVAISAIIYLIYKHKIPVPCYGCDDLSNSIFFKCISFTGKNTIGCDTYKIGKEHAGEIVDDITNISNVISKSFTKIAGEVPSILRNAITNIINLFKITLEKVWNLLSTISTIIKSAFNKIISVFTNTYKYTKDTISNILKAFKDVIYSSLTNPVNIIINQVINIKNIIIETIGSAYNKIFSMNIDINFDAIDKIILMPINFFLKILWKPVKNIYSKLKFFFEKAIWGLQKGASVTVNNTVKGIVWYYNLPIMGVNKMFEGIENAINFFPKHFNNLKDTVNSGIDRIKQPVTITVNKVNTGVNKVKSSINTIKQPINDTINKIRNTKNKIRAIPHKINMGINKAINWPINKVNDTLIAGVNRVIQTVANFGFGMSSQRITLIPQIDLPEWCFTWPSVGKMGGGTSCVGGWKLTSGIKITLPGFDFRPFSFIGNLIRIRPIPTLPESFKNIENFKEINIIKLPLIPTPKIIPDPGHAPKQDGKGMTDTTPKANFKIFGHIGDIFTSVKNFIWKLLSPIRNFLGMLWGYRLILSEMLDKFFNAAYNVITQKIENIIKYSKEQIFEIIPELLYYYVIKPIISLFVEIKNVVFKLISTIINNGIKLFKILKDNLEKIFRTVYIKIADLITYYIKIIGGIFIYIYGKTAQSVVPGNYYPTTKIIIYTLGLAYLILGPFINTTLFLFS
jgi:phage-related protein